MSHAEGSPDADCGIPHACGRVVPLSTILLDNLPTAALFALGTLILWPFGFAAALGYLAYCFLAIVLFVAFCLLGFVAIPFIAKLVGCRGCEIRDQCPWMSRKT